MNILYCGDAGIAQGVLVSILSLLKHTPNIENHVDAAKKHTKANNRGEKKHVSGLQIYIATIRYEKVRPFTEKSVEFLDKLVKGEVPGLPEEFARNTSRQNFVKLIDATKVFVENLPSKNMGSYFTPCSMLRLYMDKFLDCDRVLYLDYDVVCRGDISDFYNMDLTGVEAAGALDIYGKHFYHYHGLFRQDYMNSGVMLFNLKMCRETGMLEKAVRLCGERWMMLADQAALNKAIVARKIVARKYNEQAEQPRGDTVLHHFSNNFKFLPYFHVQKVKPHEVEKIHKILKIYEYDDILDIYRRLKGNL